MKSLIAVLVMAGLLIGSPVLAEDFLCSSSTCTNWLTKETVPIPDRLPAACDPTIYGPEVCDAIADAVCLVDELDLDEAWAQWNVAMADYFECWITNYRIWTYCVVTGACGGGR